jgi:ABC-type multidrug transport system fused ATPase/permease subunit
LARAFIKEPKVLIFDEATSALDKKNQAEVLKAIEGMKKQLGSVTCIVIAHRLSTIRDSDKIIVMKQGQIVESGSHEFLVQNYPNGIYSNLIQEELKTDIVGGK